MPAPSYPVTLRVYVYDSGKPSYGLEMSGFLLATNVGASSSNIL